MAKKMFTKDFKQVITWFTKAAEQGDVDAQCNLGVCYYTGEGVEQDYEQAITWFTKAAMLGSTVAQNYLGECYYHGKGVAQDFGQASMWFTKAAEQGEVIAQFNLGMCYSVGHGVMKDFEQAIKWFTMAAEQGHAESQEVVGLCYYLGRGVMKDFEQAIKWFTMAAEQGHASAQYVLGGCYLDGRGVEKNLEQAAMWFVKAAKQGDADAEKMLNSFKETIKHMQQMLPTKRNEVFISFSYNDKKYVDELKLFLTFLERNHGINIWCYEMLKTGDKWREKIQEHMSATRVAVLLVSPEFLASEFIRKELSELLQASKDENATIMWVPVRRSTVKDVRVNCKNGKEICIADYQAVCDPEKPLQAMNKNERDKIYIKICEGIKRCFNVS